MRATLQGFSQPAFTGNTRPFVVGAMVRAPLAWLVASGRHTKGGVP